MAGPDDEIAKLLELARSADAPDLARVSRVRARLLASGPAGGEARPTPSAAWRAARRVTRLKLGLAIAGAGLASWLALHAVPARRDPAPRRPDAGPVQAPAPPVVGGPSVIAPEPPTATSAPSPPERHPRAAPAPAPARKPGKAARSAAPRPLAPNPTQPAASRPEALPAPAREADLLRLATLALRAKQYDQARELLQRFDREYPQSAFRVEYEQLLRRWQLENGKQ